MDEDGGVLGRLPRSRPGTRSEKREGQAESGVAGAAGPSRKPERGPQPKAARAQPTPARAQGARPKAARAKRGRTPDGGRTPDARPKTTGAEPSYASGERAKAERAAKSEPRAADPVGDVVRTAGQVAGAGFRVAGTLAQGLLRRLPRR